MQLLPIVKGLASYVPGLHTSRARRRNVRFAKADYCYEVWLKHLLLRSRSGAELRLPAALAELGPGGSLGVGIAALLCGAESYYALDIVRYSETEANLALLDDLVDLFRRRAPIRIGFPVEAEVAPGEVLPEGLLERTLTDERIARIRAALTSADGRDGPITIRYVVPWTDRTVLAPASVDLILSQAVMEHVDELEDAYDAFATWLRPGGWMSHEIDFRAHGLTRAWNGHWEYPELAWRLIVGNKRYLINREPCTGHVARLRSRGFEVTCEKRQRRDDGIPRARLAKRWQGMSDEDLVTATAVLQAQLPAE